MTTAEALLEVAKAINTLAGAVSGIGTLLLLFHCSKRWDDYSRGLLFYGGYIHEAYHRRRT